MSKVRNPNTGYIMADVEAFVWDPLEPVYLSLNNYEYAVALSEQAAKELIGALQEAVDQLRVVESSDQISGKEKG